MKSAAMPRLARLALMLAAVSCSSMVYAGHGMHMEPKAPVFKPAKPFSWDNATVYFLMTDRFLNAHPGHDAGYGRQADAAPQRGYMGGDLAGVTRKIKEGYFDQLGVNAIWMTPIVEQIHGGVDEGQGKSYGFHGYWARDFTALDASLGSKKDLHELVDTAHAHGIRVLLDVVMNHVGPATAQDPAWPASWVRNEPVCTYQDIPSTVSCTLVKNLPDIRTESKETVELPPALVEKWKAEGRYEQEKTSLDAFFQRTGLPRAPRYYLMKWHTDWIREFGFDGFRADTVKHVEPEVWGELSQLAAAAYEDWKRDHPVQRIEDRTPFYMTAEVFGYNLSGGQMFTMDGGTQINFFRQGFHSLINFGFKSDAKQGYETLFSSYARALHGPLAGYSVLNYISSHDDTTPYDGERRQPYEAANKLLLSPGAAQIYYGDETSRLLNTPAASGDARLRSMMNWDELKANAPVQAYAVRDVLAHWQKLGQFRQRHPAIGAGEHQQIASQPYTFSRRLQTGTGSDKVVIALDLNKGQKTTLSVQGVFADGSTVRDGYSGEKLRVKEGKVVLHQPGIAALLEQE